MVNSKRTLTVKTVLKVENGREEQSARSRIGMINDLKEGCIRDGDES